MKHLRSALASAGLAAVLTVSLAASPAQAAKPKENDLARFCSASVQTSCVLSYGGGQITFRTKKGKVYGFTKEHKAVKYLHSHARPCLDENYPTCYRDAADFGYGSTYVNLPNGRTFYLSSLLQA